MIFAIVRSFMGEFGRALMDFYIANSLLINGSILLYGLIVFISQRNYLFVLQKIFKTLSLVHEGTKNKLIKKVSAADLKKISWEQIRKDIWLPFIAVPGKWIIKFCTVEYLRTEFTLENINSYIEDIKAKEGKEKNVDHT